MLFFFHFPFPCCFVMLSLGLPSTLGSPWMWYMVLQLSFYSLNHASKSGHRTELLTELYMLCPVCFRFIWERSVGEGSQCYFISYVGLVLVSHMLFWQMFRTSQCWEKRGAWMHCEHVGERPGSCVFAWREFSFPCCKGEGAQNS